MEVAATDLGHSTALDEYNGSSALDPYNATLAFEAYNALDPMAKLNGFISYLGLGPFNFFGPAANCSVAAGCRDEWSVYTYRPSLCANWFFFCTFLVALIIHVAIGVRHKAWSFMACMVAGCVDEMVGYAGRIWMFYDLWKFEAFMIQVVCITTAPVFFCAAIYVVLARSISTFAPALSRFQPSLLYWVFIPCDLISLILQGVGGAYSAITSGVSQVGVDIAVAGLALQVASLVIFCAIYAEFMVRYYRSGMASRQAASMEPGLTRMAFGTRLTIFYSFQALAIVMVFARCAFRVEELRKGYGGHLVHREDLFIGLEGVLIVVAALALCVGHPGLIFNVDQMRRISTATSNVEDGGLDK